MDEKMFYNIMTICEAIFESDVVRLAIHAKCLKKSKVRKQLLNKIMKLKKLKVYQDDEVCIKCIDQFERRNKLDYFVKKALDLPTDWVFDDDYLDHVDIE